MQAGGSRELEARNYLEKHRIMELLNYLTSALLFFRPGKSLAYHSAFGPTRLPAETVPRNSQYSGPCTPAPSARSPPPPPTRTLSRA